MLNKKVVLALISGLLIHSSANAGVKESVFECVYFTCPVILMRVTGIDYILENIARNKNAKLIVAATDDALFFKAHVIQTTPGELASNLYNKVVIHVAPEDVVTQTSQVQVWDSGHTSYTYEPQDVAVDVDTTQAIVIDNMQAIGVKINGRPLISKTLAMAHMAAQSMIFSDAIHVTGTDRSVYSIATDALALNDITIMFANKK